MTIAKRADHTSSQTQISQSTLDETNQSVKVTVVAGGGADGATEVTAEAILAEVEAIEAKTPALVSGRVPVDGSGVTQPVSAISLPLPTGAATSANQTAANSSLDSIDIKTPVLGQALAAASVPVVLPAAQISTLTPQTDALTDTQLRASAVPVSVAGVATETTLSAINTKTPSLVSGAVPVISGIGIVAHDAVSASFAATTDTYVFKTGGLAGTTVSTVVITYTDVTKAVLQSVVRT